MNKEEISLTAKFLYTNPRANLTQTPPVIINEYERDTLKDYIVKLQQENKQLKEKFKWKDISEYSRDKYDWVLIKYYLEDGYECVPNVAEMRSDGKWYDIDDVEVIFDIKYFFDMQELEKGDNNE